MNVRDAAAYLTERHFKCSPGTVRALYRAGKLRCHRGPSGRGPMQFTPDELGRFLCDEMKTGETASVPSGSRLKPNPKPASQPADD